jgi:hypothetical protein
VSLLNLIKLQALLLFDRLKVALASIWLITESLKKNKYFLNKLFSRVKVESLLQLLSRSVDPKNNRNLILGLIILYLEFNIITRCAFGEKI